MGYRVQMHTKQLDSYSATETSQYPTDKQQALLAHNNSGGGNTCRCSVGNVGMNALVPLKETTRDGLQGSFPDSLLSPSKNNNSQSPCAFLHREIQHSSVLPMQNLVLLGPKGGASPGFRLIWLWRIPKTGSPKWVGCIGKWRQGYQNLRFAPPV